MVEIISKVSGKKRTYINVPKKHKDLLQSGDVVKITKLNEVTKDEDSFRD